MSEEENFKTTKFYCIGDSHISIFHNEDRVLQPSLNWQQNGNFYILHIGPHLACSLNWYYKTYNDCIQDIIEDSDILLFAFGEIDCRAHVKKQSITQHKDIDIIIKEIADDYLRFIKRITQNFSNHIIIFGVIPCHIEQPFKEYYEQNPNNFDKPIGTICERNEYKLKFNNLLKEKCKELNYEFISIYEDIFNNGDIIHEYYMDEIHINPLKIKHLIKEKFKHYEKKNFSYGWFGISRHSTSKNYAGCYLCQFKKL